MFAEIIREVVFALVWVVLIVRTPVMIRDKNQHPLWAALIVIACGSIFIQSWFGTAVNAASGIADLNNLLQGMLAVVDVSVMLELVIYMTVWGGSDRTKQRAFRIAVVGIILAGMAVSFAFTPPKDRFKPLNGVEPFAWYVILVGLYLFLASMAVTWIIWRHLTHVQDGTIYAALVMIMLGSAAEIPFIMIRTLDRWDHFAVPGAKRAAFILSTFRFMLVPLGCVLVVVGPIVKNIGYIYRHARLYPIWYLLRGATPNLVLTSEEVNRSSISLVSRDPWEGLHRRVIEIRDSVFYLLDRWAWPALLEEAVRCSRVEPDPKWRKMVATACWLEVSRRLALSGQAALDQHVDRSLLPEIVATRSTLPAETKYLLAIHRCMQSRVVRDFADRIAPP
ncbi:DUF6545 domain-containing protein [Nocardia arthritidis]|uniref:DUF6545 domain-containing protein n=1 Tax=Nocardia arthritidis TaxID=228602 RepID=A0A6G9Y9X3_9NOCA|nr:DUF6545 domain-containing protein [Nocardia arthritidis]QIS09856.1 hypothetical protein F5544_09780 [Nocardia arthritidis]